MSHDKIEQRLIQLEARIAELENHDTRAAMVAVLQYLENHKRALGQERASLERAIDELREELGR